MSDDYHNGDEFGVPGNGIGQSPENVPITVSDRRRSPDTLTVNPWPVLITRNDTRDGLREFQETS